MMISLPQIIIEPDAREFLRQYASSLILRTSPRHGCCGGTVFLPIAEAGIPEAGEGWQRIEQDGISIYIEHGLTIDADTHLRIGVDKLFIWSRLWVEGLSTGM